MIHGFSAAQPIDLPTFGGRWLTDRIFIYLGAGNEPFLPAVRTPGAGPEIMDADIRLAVALRQAEVEI
jgi:hypothetical protein